MSTVILVGRRADGGRRDLLWEHCKAWWENLGFPIFEGQHEGTDPFCLAVASNDAARLAGNWKQALYIGADVILGKHEQALEALELSQRRDKLVFCHDHYYALSEAGTAEILEGAAAHEGLAEWPAWPNTFSSALAVPSRCWDVVGGFDERFVGWGGEDLAFWSACCALCHGFDRVSGPVYHLWHERVSEAREEAPGYWDNDGLMRRYLAAKGNGPVMRKILAEKETQP